MRPEVEGARAPKDPSQRLQDRSIRTHLFRRSPEAEMNHNVSATTRTRSVEDPPVISLGFLDTTGVTVSVESRSTYVPAVAVNGVNARARCSSVGASLRRGRGS